MIGYCMKCKSNKEMQNEEKVTTKNNNIMMRGICKDCGTKMCKILGKMLAEKV